MVLGVEWYRNHLIDGVSEPFQSLLGTKSKLTTGGPMMLVMEDGLDVGSGELEGPQPGFLPPGGMATYLANQGLMIKGFKEEDLGGLFLPYSAWVFPWGRIASL